MSAPEPWPLRQETLLVDCNVFRVHRDRAASPRTGTEHEFYRLEAGAWVNVAVTDVAASTVTSTDNAVEDTSPDQPTNDAPTSGVAVNVTTEPCTYDD